MNRHIGRYVCVAFALVATLVGFEPAAGMGLLTFVVGNTTLAEMNNAMKVIFEDSIYDNTVSDSELLDMFEQDDRVMTEETTGGRYIETAQYFNLPAGVRAVRAGDYIPVPDGPDVQNSRVYLRKIQGVVEMEGDVMRRVRTREGAFFDWAERALPDLVTRLNDYNDRVMLGWGAGILARVNQATPTVNMPIHNSHGIAGLDNGGLNFLEGVRVVFSANPNGDPLRDTGNPSAQVTDVDVDANSKNGQLTLSRLPTGVVDNDYIFTGDNVGQAIQGSSGDDREFMGLLGMVDDGTVLPTFQQIVRANYRKWQSVVVDASTAGSPAGVLNEDLILHTDRRVAVLGAGQPNLFVTGFEQEQQFFRSLRQDRVINDPRAYTGGRTTTSITLGGTRQVQLRFSRKMPSTLAFHLQTDTFKRWSLGRWTWDDMTGSIWNRATDSVGRKDQYYAVGYMYMQMGCFAPRKNAKIEQINPTAAVA